MSKTLRYMTAKMLYPGIKLKLNNFGNNYFYFVLQSNTNLVLVNIIYMSGLCTIQGHRVMYSKLFTFLSHLRKKYTKYNGDFLPNILTNILPTMGIEWQTNTSFIPFYARWIIFMINYLCPSYCLLAHHTGLRWHFCHIIYYNTGLHKIVTIGGYAGWLKNDSADNFTCKTYLNFCNSWFFFEILIYNLFVVQGRSRFHIILLFKSCDQQPRVIIHE
jgi:hypothetical protein